MRPAVGGGISACRRRKKTASHVFIKNRSKRYKACSDSFWRFFWIPRSRLSRRSPAQRVRREKEEQQNECALTFEKSRSKRYDVCSDSFWRFFWIPRSRLSRRSPAQRVRREKEEQQNECALTFEKSRSKRYDVCSDVAESKGFEPLWRCRLTVFKTAPL